jgi:hypothetical protein
MTTQTATPTVPFTPRDRAIPAVAERPSPLAYVAPARDMAGRPVGRRAAEQLASVLAEFGMRTIVGDGAPGLPMAGETRAPIEGAALMVVDVVRPTEDLPVEVAIAQMLDIPLIALVPEGVEIRGLAADLLADAVVVRYDGQPPRHVLARVLEEAYAVQATITDLACWS